MFFGIHRILDKWRLAADESLSVVRRTMRSGERQAAERPLQLSQLEDRILFSASPIPAEVAQVAVDTAHAATSGSMIASTTANADAPSAAGPELTRSSQVETRRELIFIDPAADNYRQLVDDLKFNADPDRSLNVYLLDQSRDGVEQISETLARYDQLDAIHIVSHATEGKFRLGNTWLGGDNLGGYAGELGHWGNALSSDADLMFYGCDLAGNESGQLLLDSIATLTGADVAASDDDTGHASLGGDWELEYRSGAVETSVAFSKQVQQDWVGLLPNAAITGRETVDADGNGQIDHIRITVDSNLNDDFNDLSMTVAGYALDAVTPYISNIGAGGAGDAIFYVKLVEGGAPDTGSTPVVQVVSNSLLQGGGNVLATDAGVAAADNAAPVIVSATAANGSSELTVTFSEAVDTSNVGAGDLLATDFGYVDVSTSGASAISSMGSDADGTDSVIRLYLDDATIAADSGDTVSAAAAEIYDLADNAASTASAPVSIHTLTVTGASTVQTGELYTLNLGYTGPATITSWTINWGDGAIETFAGNPASVTHTYTNAGFTNNILASASDGSNTYLQNQLLVARGDNDTVEWYGTAGDPLGEFGPDAGLDYPTGMIVGPDGNTYVSGWNSGNVVRYDASGVFVDEFVDDLAMTFAAGLAFGPDGNLYVASQNSDEIRRYDATTGNLMDVFVSAGSGGLSESSGIAFGPDGDLYVASYTGDAVYRFNGVTGDPWNDPTAIWVTAGSAGLKQVADLAFGPTGDLFVASEFSDEILRFKAVDGTPVGDGKFVTGVSQVDGPIGIEFGPDGNLYITTVGAGNVVRVDGATGAYIDEFVKPGSGGLNQADFATFLPGHQVTVAKSPTILSRQTADLDGDGYIDAIHITFDKAIQDSTVSAGDWDVAGVVGEAFSSTTNGDTADDADIYITFADGVLDTGATPDVTYSRGTLADTSGNLLVSDSADPWWDHDWLSRKKITFDNSNSSENLVDFPVLVSLNSGNIDFSKIKAGGADIRFVDDDGTELNYEIEAWDDGGETASLWVKVQQVDLSSSADFIHIYYNNTAATDGQNAAGVWDASYQGVWHLNDDVVDEATSGAHVDSTGVNNGSQIGNVEGTGRIGDGQVFDGNDYLDIPNSVLSPTAGTVSLWMQATDTTAKRYAFGNENSSDNDRLMIGRRSDDTLFIGLDSTYPVPGITHELNQDEWYQATVSWQSDGSADIYLNGALVTSVSGLTYDLDIQTGANLGSFNEGESTHWIGSIDEVRVSDTARSADWVKASYLAQVGAFTSFGGQETTTADNAAPIVLSRKTADLDSDGFSDAIEVTFSEAIDDTSVSPGDWDVAGATGEAFASTTAGDAADDADIFITFADGVLDTGATPNVTYTLGTLADTAGNLLSSNGPLAAVDAIAPSIISKETADLDRDGFIDAIHVKFSEAIQDVTVSAGDWDVAGVTGEAFSSTTNGDTASDADIYITFADGVLDTGATPDVTYAQGTLADANGNLLASDSGDSWWDHNWLSRKKITFDNSNSSQNLVDFPVLVSLDSSNIKFAKVKAGGADIRFVDDDGAELNYEIESWDDGGETATIWVKVQQVDLSSNADYIHLYYNNAAATDAQNAAAVWDASHVGVWHLDESGNGNVGEFQDSTSNNNDGQGGSGAAGAAPTQVSTGKIGKAQFFDNTDDHVNIASAASLGVTDDMTVSAWVKRSDFTWGSILAKTDLSSTFDYAFYFDDDDTLGFWADSTTPNQLNSVATIKDNAWHYVTFSRSGSDVVFYIDGVDAGGGGTMAGSFNNSADPVRIGDDEEAGAAIGGSLDEVRLSNTARSAEWIEASYLSQHGAFSFTSFGGEEVGVADKAAPVLLSASSPQANSTSIFQVVGQQLDLVFSETLGGAISEVDLEAALTFAGGATDGDNLPTIGIGANPIALVATSHSSDTLRVTYNTNNTANADSLLVGTHTVQVADGSNLTDQAGNTADTTVAAVTINNTGNSAPSLDNTGTMTLPDINEDDANPAGSTVQSIIDSAGGDRITDSDAAALEGFAVIGVDNTKGVWQYDAGGGWTAFGAVTNNNAVLLNATAKIRFVPIANHNGSSGNLTFRAWDQTSGGNGQTGVDVSANGGSTAFSTATEVASLNVDPVNDEPTLTSFTNPVDTTSEDLEVEVSFTDLTAAGDESDLDGSVDAFVVKTVSSGTLTIGATAGTATAWVAGTNDTIDGGRNAYWKPDLDATGTQSAFEVVAEDDSGLESSTAVMAEVGVTPVNDHSPVADAESMAVIQGGTTTEAGLNAGATLLDGDTDLDLPDDTLTVNTTPVVGPRSGMLTLNANGTFQYTHNGSVNFSDSFTYEVRDAVGNTDTATVTITITPVFVPPPPPPPTDPPDANDNDPPLDEPVIDEPSVDEPTDDEPSVEEATVDDATNDGDGGIVSPHRLRTGPGQRPPGASMGVSIFSNDVSLNGGLTLMGASGSESSSEQRVKENNGESRRMADEGAGLEAVAIGSEFSALPSYAPEFIGGFDELRQEVGKDELFHQAMLGSSLAVTTSLSVGYVIWLIRGGVLLSSLLTSLPAWQMVDPLPVLGYLDEDALPDADDESLATLVEKSNSTEGEPQ